MEASQKKNGITGRVAGWMDWFPFGTAPLIVLVLVVISGVYLLLHPARGRQATLTFWTFASSHYLSYMRRIPDFEARHAGATPGERTSVDVQHVHINAVTSRLRAAFWANLDVPDLVEVEISRAGSFFRGPPEDVGFVDLTPYLERTTSIGGRDVRLIDHVVKTRLAPYSTRRKETAGGETKTVTRIYGLPHDVHPVMIAYRADILEPELAKRGMTVSDLDEWGKFIALGRELTRLSKDAPRYMLELSDTSRTHIEMFLFQRGGGYFDAKGNLTMDDAVAVQTLMWYVPLVAGPGRIGFYFGWGSAFARALQEGAYICVMAPDWRTKIIENDVRSVKGKMKLMPLPAFARGGRRTTTWGGTMVGITKACKHKELAWKLALYLYYDTTELARSFRQTNILPPLKLAWGNKAFDEPREFWMGQKVGREYLNLADRIPPQYASPYVELAKEKLGQALSECVQHYRSQGPGGFEAFVRGTLKARAAEVRRQMERNPF